MAKVYSPILSSEGSPVYLGSTPDLQEEQGLEALEAAKKAYDNGRGVWPTAPASARIAAMEKFISLMVPIVPGSPGGRSQMSAAPHTQVRSGLRTSLGSAEAQYAALSRGADRTAWYAS